MDTKIVITAIILTIILSSSQTISITHASHNSDNDNARKNSEEKSKNYDRDGNVKETIEEKRKAFEEYRKAFKAWKTANEEYKSVKNSGDQATIDAKK